MKKHYILIAILVLLLAAFVFLFGIAATSVVPGWHTTIYPPYYAWVFIAIITLFFGTIGYWLYIKQISKLNWVLFIVYFLLTTITYFFVKFPSVFLAYEQGDHEALFKRTLTIIRLRPIANRVLIITQVLFAGYIVRTFMIYRKRARLF